MEWRRAKRGGQRRMRNRIGEEGKEKRERERRIE